ncbi:MAG TPA: sigma 54-interacting transcriptional regulator [Kofleriaceae bacterium]|nr:sigma 54-interacting transcriptional regulator [Kofleriaceae bacterium]
MSWVFELPQSGEVVIGRGDSAELRLRDQSVSRRHAILKITKRSVMLTDLGSHNGTFVNGSRIATERELHSGDSVAICAATLVLFTSARTTSGSRWLPYLQLRDRIEQEVERALRYERPFALLCGLLARDADHEHAQRALVALRGLDVCSWVDATQFLILAPETDPDHVPEMARRLREALGDLDVKIGYSVCPMDGGDAELLVVGARAAAAGTSGTAVAGVTTSLRTYRIGNRNAIVADPAMARLYALVDRLARVDLPVLITGETGTGKELAATMLHERSPRRGKPLVALNCAAISETLVESELFGHERGAFSGAHATKQGLLESGDGGTVFLDEIGELSLAIQAKLLRVLEAQRLTRVGDVREREINVRLVAATNRSLQDEVDTGRFRKDLYFRLSGATLAVPPLRDRKRELPLLAELFLSEACRIASRGAVVLAPDALQALEAYRWPGNVRELKNVMEYCAATVPDHTITAAHLAVRLGPPKPARAATADIGVAPRVFVPIADEIRALEIRRMTQALDAADGNQTKAAELIGMPLRTFFTKMRLYNLRK